MPRMIHVNIFAPGFGANEILSGQINLLIDFAQFSNFPTFHTLVQTLDTLEKKYGNILCNELPSEVQEILLDIQSDVIIHTYSHISQNQWLVKKSTALVQKLREDPNHVQSASKLIACKIIGATFEHLFLQEIEDYSWHCRILAKFIWKFDNWQQDVVIRLSSLFMEDSINEISYWKMARLVSIARAMEGIRSTYQQKRSSVGALFHDNLLIILKKFAFILLFYIMINLLILMN